MIQMITLTFQQWPLALSISSIMLEIEKEWFLDLLS
jgi:hypothetical protein